MMIWPPAPVTVTGTVTPEAQAGPGRHSGMVTVPGPGLTLSGAAVMSRTRIEDRVNVTPSVGGQAGDRRWPGALTRSSASVRKLNCRVGGPGHCYSDEDRDRRPWRHAGSLTCRASHGDPGPAAASRRPPDAAAAIAARRPLFKLELGRAAGVAISETPAV